MFNIITFGSATLDIFAISEKTKLWKIEKKQGFFLPLGEKIEGEKIFLRTGGGGTNVAATFAKQGFKTAFCGMIGDDFFGKLVLEELKKFNINTDFVFKKEKEKTNCSIVVSAGKKGRAILVCRNASKFLSKKEIPFQKADWFYIAPLSGETASNFETLVTFAHKNGIKIALNPGKYQLTLPKSKINKILEKTDILILNKEEANILAEGSEEKIFKKLSNLTKGIIIITDGQKGVSVFDRKFIYKAGILKGKVIDKTGAGDSFGSGFVSEFIRNKNIISAIQLGTANATGCLRKVGAKQGILEKKETYPKVKVIKTEIK